MVRAFLQRSVDRLQLILNRARRVLLDTHSLLVLQEGVELCGFLFKIALTFGHFALILDLVFAFPLGPVGIHLIIDRIQSALAPQLLPVFPILPIVPLAHGALNEPRINWPRGCWSV